MEYKIQALNRIKEFVSNLNDASESQFHEVVLYDKLLSISESNSDKAIIKNNAIFAEFMAKNKEAVLNRDHTLIVTNIVYSEGKIFLDLKKIMNVLSDKIKDSSWDHLWGIAAFVFPKLGTKDLLKERMNRENKFIENLTEKIQNSVTPNSKDDPMECIATMIATGQLQELSKEVGENVSKGGLNLNRLMNCVKNMMTEQLSEEESQKVDGLMGQLLGGSLSSLNIPTILPPNKATLETIPEEKEE